MRTSSDNDSKQRSPLAPVRAKVLVTVKTYPTPSLHYMETVCVAGVRLDTPTPEWVRLYPIPFRTESFDYPFAKYQVLDLVMQHRGAKDPRPESFSPDLQKIQLGETVPTRRNWAQRRELLGDLIGATTTCELIAINRETTMDQPAPSLGLVKPINPRITAIEPGAAWNDRQQLKADRAAMPTLFSPDAEIKHKLEPPAYVIKLHYKCETAGCPGHRPTILDWEVGSAAFWWRKRYPAHEIPERLQAKWEELMGEDRDTHFYIGNQHQRRHAFSVLGIWSPKL